jgi:hypothetical protein
MQNEGKYDYLREAADQAARSTCTDDNCEQC